MNRPTILIAVLLGLLFIGATGSERWGFWGHRRLNRMAVFTLPPEMIGFYKQHIEFITEHAVDPDKRRYATRHEAVRHYIDIDHWGEAPFPEVPRGWVAALMKYTELGLVRGAGDTIRLRRDTLAQQVLAVLPLGNADLKVPYNTAYRQFFTDFIMPQYYEDKWTVPCDTLAGLFGVAGSDIGCASVYAIDHFSPYGIVPYFLPVMQSRLTKAFRDKDVQKILRLSAEFGHYIGDAHVPLHTTENYNGQLTNQTGIHAFWESRIPELFADQQYNYFVGKAEYISDPESYFWDVVLTSHGLVDSVLNIERRLSKNFPEDKQYCYEERLGRTIRTYCREYAAAYQNRMAGMVEDRMQATILSIGSCWYTAWVDAGQPDLRFLDEYQPTAAELREREALQKEVQSGRQKGRVHE